MDQHASGWICVVSHIRHRAGKSRVGYLRNGYTLEEIKAKLPRRADRDRGWNEPVLRFFHVGLRVIDVFNRLTYWLAEGISRSIGILRTA